MPAEPGSSTQTDDEIALDADLRTALRDGQLRLAFQPEWDLRTQQVLAVEALVRWNRPDHGAVEAEALVAVAERTGLICDLGSWVLERGLAELAKCAATIDGLDVTLRVNASVTQLERLSYVDDVSAALARHGVPARRLCIEITETGPRTRSHIGATIDGLRGCGVSVAVDDLANGYSTLAMVRDYPVDVIKIDRTLITGIDTDRRAAAVVRALVALSSELGLGLVAEGIETAAEREVLLELGCRRGQGYLLSVPLTGAEMLDRLDASGRRRPRPRRC